MKPAVADFYANRSILVTGFTGFVGKALVEKLLRSVPRLKSVYVLIRPMKGDDARQRMEKVVESDLFDLLRKQQGESGEDVLSKLIPIEGDMTKPGLGLTVDDAKTICECVSVVFHSAATVKFDEHMSLAVKMNVQGTKSLLDLSCRMKRLVAFVHTSTAYCNCDRTYIVERVYPSPIPWQKLIDSTQWIEESMLERLAPLLIGSRPNSYTFTKAVAESMLVDDRAVHNRLPIVIVRPSIVTAAWKEPKPGWIDNVNGATGLIALGAKGLIRTLYGRLHEVRADLVPVDVVVNMLIVAGWHQAAAAGGPIRVIHCTTGRLNPVSWGHVIEGVCEYFSHKMPLADFYRVPGGKSTTWRLEYEMRLFLQHVVPAYLLDWTFALIGRRGCMVKLYEKIMRVLNALEYFYTNQWNFQSKLVVLLNNQLSEADREKFYIDVTRIDWTEYMDDYYSGVRKHVFKEDPSNLPTAKRAHARRRLLMAALDVSLVTFLLCVVMRNRKTGSIFWRLVSLVARTGSRMKQYVQQAVMF